MRSVARATRGEVRKLVHPGLFLLAFICLAIIWQDAGQTSGYAKLQARLAVAVTLDNAKESRVACGGGPRSNSEECKLSKMDRETNKYFEGNGRRLGAVAQSLNGFPGILTFVTHEYFTGIGLLFLAGMAALHVSREFAYGSAAATITAGGPDRFLMSKALSLWIVTCLSIAASAAVLYLGRSTFAETIQVPTSSIGPKGAFAGKGVRLRPEATWSSWTHSLRAFAVASLVLFFVALLFAAVAALFRRPTTAAAVLAVVPVGLFGLATWAKMRNATPLYQLADLIGLDNTPWGVQDSRLWDASGQAQSLYTSQPPHVGSVSVLIFWLSGVILFSVSAGAYFRSRKLIA